jgi:hypothetical protein
VSWITTQLTFDLPEAPETSFLLPYVSDCLCFSGLWHRVDNVSEEYASSAFHRAIGSGRFLYRLPDCTLLHVMELCIEGDVYRHLPRITRTNNRVEYKNIKHSQSRHYTLKEKTAGLFVPYYICRRGGPEIRPLHRDLQWSTRIVLYITSVNAQQYVAIVTRDCAEACVKEWEERSLVMPHVKDSQSRSSDLQEIAEWVTKLRTDFT